MRTSTQTRRSALRGARDLAAGWSAIAALAACGGPSETGVTGQGAAPIGKLVELIAHGQGTSDGEGYDKNVAAFNKAYEGKYKATHVQNTGDNYVVQETEFAAGTGADLYYAHTSNMKHQEYAVKGVANTTATLREGSGILAYKE